MSDEKLIHVTVEDATQDELKEIRDFMERALEDYDGNGKIVVSSDRMDLHEVPALDEYVDELADRVAERIGGNDE